MLIHDIHERATPKGERARGIVDYPRFHKTRKDENNANYHWIGNRRNSTLILLISTNDLRIHYSES